MFLSRMTQPIKLFFIKKTVAVFQLMSLQNQTRYGSEITLTAVLWYAGKLRMTVDQAYNNTSLNTGIALVSLLDSLQLHCSNSIFEMQLPHKQWRSTVLPKFCFLSRRNYNVQPRIHFAIQSLTDGVGSLILTELFIGNSLFFYIML